MKLPKKYLTKNPNVMRREVKKHAHKRDDDSSAYGPWDADYKSRKAGVGKKVGTKTSKYTKKYKQMFGENLITDPYEFITQPQRFPHEDGADLGDNYIAGLTGLVFRVLL